MVTYLRGVEVSGVWVRSYMPVAIQDDGDHTVEVGLQEFRGLLKVVLLDCYLLKNPQEILKN